jgi:hypothetical protein
MLTVFSLSLGLLRSSHSVHLSQTLNLQPVEKKQSKREQLTTSVS